MNEHGRWEEKNELKRVLITEDLKRELKSGKFGASIVKSCKRIVEIINK